MGKAALILAVIWGVWGPAVAGATEARPGEGPALRGLAAVAVTLGEIAPEALQAGVSGEALLAGVRERVAGAGLSGEAGPEAPRLLVDLQVFHLKAAGLFAFSLTLALEETVSLARLPGAPVTARTWTASSVGTSLSGKLGEVVHGAAERLADRFADDLAVANPPR